MTCATWLSRCGNPGGTIRLIHRAVKPRASARGYKALNRLLPFDVTAKDAERRTAATGSESTAVTKARLSNNEQSSRDVRA